MNLLNALKGFNKKIKNRLSIDRNGDLKNRMADSDINYVDDNTEENYFDGMGIVTATEIVKERIDEDIISEYGIDELKNTGRYYIARMSESNGSVDHTLLVDKQNGMVRSLYRKASKTHMS